MIRRVPDTDGAIAINALVTGTNDREVQSSVKLGLLDSALNAPFAGFGDTDLYPEDHQRLGILCSRIVLNHPFVDGNKRTGFLVMLEAAHMNGVALTFDDQKLIADRIEQLAAPTLDEDAFCEHVRAVLRRS